MLTDARCKSATCPEGKTRSRVTDANGLYLEVSPAGSKRWFWKTYADGKEGRMALGSYPSVSLMAARKARDAAKLQKSKGVNPVQARKVAIFQLTPATKLKNQLVRQLAFFACYRVFTRVPAGSCGLRREPFLPATGRFYSPFAYSLSDPAHPVQAKVRKARPSPLYKSTGYARTNRAVFLWHW